MDRLRHDLRLALRGFRRTPAFCVTATGILGLGIGMSVAMFTVFRTVLVRRLPVSDQDRIAVMWTYRDPSTDVALGPNALAEIRRQSRTMRDIAAVAHWGAVPSPLLDGDRVISLAQGLVTANFFEVLGARAVLGRLFRASDEDVGAFRPDGANASRTLVLSYRAWQEQFGGDSSVIGRRLVEGVLRWTYTVIGVAPPGLEYPSGAEFWIPMRGGWASPTSSFAVARLAPGASIASARDEYLAISNRVDSKLRARGAHAATFAETVVGNVEPVIAVLTAAVALLLLIACLNVGNLLLLRASSRTREVAVRRALGASYGDIVRQLLVEAGVLAACGGALGFGVAVVLLRLLPILAPRNLPRLDEIQLSGAPVLAALAISSIAVLIFGVLPALIAARSNLASPLRFDSRSGSETRRRRVVRQTLVASQVALAMIMLGGAALLARSLERLERQDSGYISDHLSILDLTWDIAKVNTAAKTAALAEQLQKRFMAVPGVSAATPLVVPPLLGTGGWQLGFSKDGQSDAEAASNPRTNTDIVGSDFFRTFGVPVARGRAFTDADRAGAPLVAIVSESFARGYWPSEDPIGKRVRLPHAAEEGLVGGDGWRTVVGLAGDTRLRTVREVSPMAYLPIGQGYWQGTFAIRATLPLSGLLPSLRAAGREPYGGTELWRAQSMDQLLAGPLAEPRVSALLMSSFGLVALFLAAIGLYGVMASLVRDQTRDIGIRIALGATDAHVRREVLSWAGIVMSVGIGVGLLGAVGTSRLLGALLCEVSPTDPVALGGACVVLLVVGIVAAYLPARRASRIDPVQALRAD